MIENMIEKLEYLNRQSEILLKPPTNAQNVPEFGEFIKLVIKFREELYKTKTALEKLKKERKNYCSQHSSLSRNLFSSNLSIC